MSDAPIEVGDIVRHRLFQNRVGKVVRPGVLIKSNGLEVEFDPREVEVILRKDEY